MRNKLRLGLIAVSIPMLLTMNASWAGKGGTPGCLVDSSGDNNSQSNCVKAPDSDAPEINAGAGVGAIALLVGGLLLAAEKRRHSI